MKGNQVFVTHPSNLHFGMGMLTAVSIAVERRSSWAEIQLERKRLNRTMGMAGSTDEELIRCLWWGSLADSFESANELAFPIFSSFLTVSLSRCLAPLIELHYRCVEQMPWPLRIWRKFCLPRIPIRTINMQSEFAAFGFTIPGSTVDSNWKKSSIWWS